MHIIIMLAQGPEAIRNTVYGADNVFIPVKRSVFRGTALNLFPELLRKFSTGCRIVIGIGNNINQLAVKAHALGFIDAPMLKNEALR